MQKLDASILVVDDEALNRDLLSHKLAKEGYTVTTASSGQQAIDIMAVEQFDLVLLDIMMPDVTGYDVLMHIQLESKLKDRTSVMMISASNDRDTVIRCIEMGAADFLVKPFNMPVVKSRIWRNIYNRYQLATNPQLQESQGTANILIVDDQEFNLDLLSKRLEGLGYNVQCAENGEQALEILNEVPFDLILLDIMMPGMSGYEVLDYIRTKEATNHIPVIMVTALDDLESVKKSIMIGADDYLMKPVNTVILKTRIESCLKKRCEIPESNSVII